MNNLTNNITSFSKKFILTVHYLQMIKDIIYLTCPLLLENHFPGCKIGDRRKRIVGFHDYRGCNYGKFIETLGTTN